MDNKKSAVTSVDRPSRVIDAIAIGVEARVDPFSIYSKSITQSTIRIARQLNIAEEEIQRWAIVQAKRHSKKDNVIRMVSPELLIER